VRRWPPRWSTFSACSSATARKRFQVVEAAADHDTILAAVRRSGVEALIVTRDRRSNQPPLGIITHADVLFRS
jgi:predicted transcriptional regulator